VQKTYSSKLTIVFGWFFALAVISSYGFLQVQNTLLIGNLTFSDNTGLIQLVLGIGCGTSFISCWISWIFSSFLICFFFENIFDEDINCRQSVYLLLGYGCTIFVISSLIIRQHINVLSDAMTLGLLTVSSLQSHLVYKRMLIIPKLALAIYYVYAYISVNMYIKPEKQTYFKFAVLLVVVTVFQTVILPGMTSNG